MHKQHCSGMARAVTVATVTTSSGPTPGEMPSATLHFTNPFINRYLTIVL